MTPEQIELEYEHITYDNQLKKGGEVYEDDEYDAYDEETDKVDSRLSDMPMLEAEGDAKQRELEQSLSKSIEKTKADDWEYVEIDELDSEED